MPLSRHPYSARSAVSGPACAEKNFVPLKPVVYRQRAINSRVVLEPRPSGSETLRFLTGATPRKAAAEREEARRGESRKEYRRRLRRLQSAAQRAGACQGKRKTAGSGRRGLPAGNGQ